MPSAPFITVRLLGLVLLAMMLGTAVGCTAEDDSKRPTSVDRALKDPMGYGPKPGSVDKPKDRTDGFDRDGLNRDLKNVFNP